MIDRAVSHLTGRDQIWWDALIFADFLTYPIPDLTYPVPILTYPIPASAGAGREHRAEPACPGATLDLETTYPTPDHARQPALPAA